jgi:hypothetical protein
MAEIARYRENGVTRVSGSIHLLLFRVPSSVSSGRS